MGAQREIGWVINMGDCVVVLDSRMSRMVEWDVMSWVRRAVILHIRQGTSPL